MTAGGFRTMVTITFPDRETEKRALAYLLGRFSGRVFSFGEHVVPEAALEALADQDIPFTVKSRTIEEQQVSQTPSQSLDQLLKGVTDENRHAEVDTGP